MPTTSGYGAISQGRSPAGATGPTSPAPTWSAPTPPAGRATRATILALVVALIGLGVLVLITHHSMGRETSRSFQQARLAAIYQDARFWVGQEESLERKYRLAGRPIYRAVYEKQAAS